jgi:hypothetical protein
MKQISYLLFVVTLGTFLSACVNPKGERSVVVGDTITTESGLKYVFTKIGNGRSVETGSRVSTYLALSVEGKEVWNTNGPPDSSFVFIANKDRMIKGFTEVTMKLREGDEIVAILPAALAYGEKGSPPVIPPNATLVYTKYIMKKVNAPKASISDTLLLAYQSGGHEKMVATYQQIINSPDTAQYYYDKGQWRILWNLLTEADMHNEALQMIAYVNTTNDSGMRWYRVRTYDKLEQYKLALDSLDALLASDTAMTSNTRAAQLRLEKR